MEDPASVVCCSVALPSERCPRDRRAELGLATGEGPAVVSQVIRFLTLVGVLLLFVLTQGHAARKRLAEYGSAVSRMALIGVVLLVVGGAIATVESYYPDGGLWKRFFAPERRDDSAVEPEVAAAGTGVTKPLAPADLSAAEWISRELGGAGDIAILAADAGVFAVAPASGREVQIASHRVDRVFVDNQADALWLLGGRGPSLSVLDLQATRRAPSVILQSSGGVALAHEPSLEGHLVAAGDVLVLDLSGGRPTVTVGEGTYAYLDYEEDNTPRHRARSSKLAEVGIQNRQSRELFETLASRMESRASDAEGCGEILTGNVLPGTGRLGTCGKHDGRELCGRGVPVFPYSSIYVVIAMIPGDDAETVMLTLYDADENAFVDSTNPRRRLSEPDMFFRIEVAHSGAYWLVDDVIVAAETKTVEDLRDGNGGWLFGGCEYLL